MDKFNLLHRIHILLDWVSVYVAHLLANKQTSDWLPSLFVLTVYMTLIRQMTTPDQWVTLTTVGTDGIFILFPLRACGHH